MQFLTPRRFIFPATSVSFTHIFFSVSHVNLCNCVSCFVQFENKVLQLYIIAEFFFQVFYARRTLPRTNIEKQEKNTIAHLQLRFDTMYDLSRQPDLVYFDLNKKIRYIYSYHLVLMHRKRYKVQTAFFVMLIRALRHVMIIDNRCSAASN